MNRKKQVDEKNCPTKWDYFKYGIKIHPGNGFYIAFTFMLLLAAIKNNNIVTGLAFAGIFIAFLWILWVFTSIDVGRINWDQGIENE